jgi:hypothetical protein
VFLAQFWDIVGGTCEAWEAHLRDYPTLDDFRRGVKAKGKPE